MKAISYLFAFLLTLAIPADRAIATPGTNGSDNENPGVPFQTLTEKVDQNYAAIQNTPQAVKDLLNANSSWISPYWRNYFSNPRIISNVIIMNPDSEQDALVRVLWWRADGSSNRESEITVPASSSSEVTTNVGTGFCNGLGNTWSDCQGWVEVKATHPVIVDGYIRQTLKNNASVTIGISERTMTWYPVDTETTDDNEP